MGLRKPIAMSVSKKNLTNQATRTAQAPQVLEALGTWSNRKVEPDYSNYSIEELNDALSNIDKEAYPQRTNKIELEIVKRSQIQSAAKEQTVLTNEKKFGVGFQLFFALLSVLFFYNGVTDLLEGETYVRGGNYYNPTDNPLLFYGNILLYIGLSIVFFVMIYLGRRKNTKRT